jgi:hypothetical protein
MKTPEIGTLPAFLANSESWSWTYHASLPAKNTWARWLYLCRNDDGTEHFGPRRRFHFRCHESGQSFCHYQPRFTPARKHSSRIKLIPSLASVPSTPNLISFPPSGPREPWSDNRPSHSLSSRGASKIPPGVVAPIKNLREETVRGLPKNSTQIQILSEVTNTLLINGHKTYEVTIAYMCYGQRYRTSVLFANLDQQQLRCRVLAQASDFERFTGPFPTLFAVCNK